jgi:hypothetical protein
MIRTGRLAALVLLAALSGCGGNDEPKSAGTPEAEPSSASSSSSPTSPPSPTPSVSTTSSADVDAEPVSPAEAQRALQKGLRELLGGGSVDFRYRMNVGTTALTETTGRAAIDGGWRSSTHFSEELAAQIDEGEEVPDYRMEVLAPGNRDVFMQMVGWPEPAAGCWLQMSPGEVPVGFLAMTPGIPAYVGVLGAVKALGFDPDHVGSEVVATMSLRGALLLLHRRIRGLSGRHQRQRQVHPVAVGCRHGHGAGRRARHDRGGPGREARLLTCVTGPGRR